MSRAVHVMVFEGYADWEPALALAELRRTGGFAVRSVGFWSGPVVSMGGLRVVPDLPLSALDPGRVRLLIVPGGDVWEAGSYPRIPLEAALHALRGAGVPIAAICGATLALARAGLLDAVAHTSNDRAWLEAAVPEYRGGGRYRGGLAVRDGGVITASGCGQTEFAREVLAELSVLSPEDRETWFQVYKTGEWAAAAS